MQSSSPQAKPPIPSPFGGPDEDLAVPARRKPVENYFLLIALGVTFFFLLRGAIMLMGPLVISVLMLVLYAALALAATQRLKGVGHRLGYRVRNEQDLQAAKQVIALNMQVSFLMIAITISFLAALVLTNNGLFSFLLLTVTVPVGMYSTREEARFRAMVIEPENPELTRRFQDYLRQWKECRIKLED
jgi:hypothetical protein